MYNRLHRKLPVMLWKRVNRLTPQEASSITLGDTSKFIDRDFWTLGASYRTEKDIPINSLAVYYHGYQWWMVQKVKNF